MFGGEEAEGLDVAQDFEVARGEDAGQLGFGTGVAGRRVWAPVVMVPVGSVMVVLLREFTLALRRQEGARDWPG